MATALEIKHNRTCLLPEPRGLVDNALDCDDTAQRINPAASEICDSLDNDCDQLIDDDDPSLDIGGLVVLSTRILMDSAIQTTAFRLPNSPKRSCEQPRLRRQPLSCQSISCSEILRQHR